MRSIRYHSSYGDLLVCYSLRIAQLLRATGTSQRRRELFLSFWILDAVERSICLTLLVVIAAGSCVA